MSARSYIVFQAYGNEDILRECLFALLTFSRFHPAGVPADTELWIYTDREDWFGQFADCPLPLRFRRVDAALVREWRGELDFVHRMKIEVLRDFVKNRNGAVLYLDTDVCFLDSVAGILAHIHDGALYMHVQESIIRDEANPLLRKLHRFLLRNSPLSVNGRTLTVPADTAMWNAGVLGFHTDRAPLLDAVLALSDSIYRQFPKHVTEQFAFSFYFQQTAPVRSSAAHVLHYWNFKEMRAYLQSFFAYFRDTPWQELSRYTALIQPHVPLQEMISFYRSRSCWDKLRRKSWQPPSPDWPSLLEQMQQ